MMFNSMKDHRKGQITSIFLSIYSNLFKKDIAECMEGGIKLPKGHTFKKRDLDLEKKRQTISFSH